MASETREVELAGKQVVVTGPRGSGKSTIIQSILRRVPAHVVYDMNHEHGDFKRYVADYRRGEEMRAEVDGFVSRMVTDNDPEKRPALVVLEEANRYVPNAGKIPEAVGELVDLGRHYQTPAAQGVAVMYVTRRPAKLDTDVTELADYFIVAGPTGKNGRKRLNEEVPGLGDAATDLDGYEWLFADRSGFDRMEPVEPGNTTGSL